MKILYLDTACTAFAERSKNADSHWEPHCARIAAIFEDTDVPFMPLRDLCHLIRPEPGWEMSPAAFAYHKAERRDFAESDVAAGKAASELRELAAEVDAVVGHNAAFHRTVTEALFTDAGYDGPAWVHGPWYCTMASSMPVLRLPTKNSRGYKRPKLTEAFEHFAGTPMPVHEVWYPLGATNAKAVRLIYRGLNPAVSTPNEK